MKWEHKEKIFSDKRVIRRFLLFPRTIGNETRWLEWAEIEQELVHSMDYFWWEDVKWITVN